MKRKHIWLIYSLLSIIIPIILSFVIVKLNWLNKLENRLAVIIAIVGWL